MKICSYFRAAVRVFTLAILPIALYGCVAAALVPLAPLVGGMAPESTKVVINDATVTPELKYTFSTVKTITLVGGDRSSSYMAEYLDEQRAFAVRIEHTGNLATPTQRREEMQKVCSKVSPPDLVLSSSLGNSDAGTGTTIGAMFTGRANFSTTGIIEVLRCKDGWNSRFGVTAEVSQGLYNADRSKLNQVLGQELGKALMQLAGKAVPDSNGKQTPTNLAAPAGTEQPVAATDAPVIGLLPANAPARGVSVPPAQSPPMTLAQAQTRLKALGYAIGQADGIMGPKTRSELKRFQRSRGISETGELDADTTAALR